jgi:NAD(P)H-hydrate repair Nnr-like enzyme with NAD(P)H-hydrate epimerase domain
MMQNAGRSLPQLAVTRFAPASVTVLAGPGGNPGGRVAAHLLNRGRTVSVVLSDHDSLTPGAGREADVLARMAR